MWRQRRIVGCSRSKAKAAWVLVVTLVERRSAVRRRRPEGLIEVGESRARTWSDVFEKDFE
jgi:hypothetical protein